MGFSNGGSLHNHVGRALKKKMQSGIRMEEGQRRKGMMARFFNGRTTMGTKLEPSATRRRNRTKNAAAATVRGKRMKRY